ncbi:hypothetical protein [Candidatus Finniella inopinata]|uniref:Uncharacterized protein n=1 Tax=Candidatus Finniella inopinata TaxID=1696036 RepID=A0A4Q7DHN6_9PROT|nr:hypothetical protein [Candidatus Finniella inopinata]RZI45434.1 hypothetical protein EQU50_07030 [Candidatus Finniella inopinata]
MQTQAISNSAHNNVRQFPAPKQEGRNLTDQLGFTIEGVIDKDVMTAKAFPRDVRQCIKNIELTIAMSPEVSASCYYTLPRAGKTITGPSIRLAEICSSFWGNMQSGTRVISNNGKSVVVEGWCLDLETNAKVSHEISRGIVTKDGKPYSTDMQNTTIAAASAIAFRNVIFKTIPKVFIDQALQKAMALSVAASNQEDFEKKRQNMFENLERLGIHVEKVFAFFGKSSIQEFDLEHMKMIYGIRTSIKEGMIKADEAFALSESRSDMVNSLIDDH